MIKPEPEAPSRGEILEGRALIPARLLSDNSSEEEEVTTVRPGPVSGKRTVPALQLRLVEGQDRSPAESRQTVAQVREPACQSLAQRPTAGERLEGPRSRLTHPFLWFMGQGRNICFSRDQWLTWGGPTSGGLGGRSRGLPSDPYTIATYAAGQTEVHASSHHLHP